MLGNMIDVQISREIFHAGSYGGRNYTVHLGVSSDDGNVLHNILIFSPDKPINNTFVNVRVMAVTELGGRIYYICAEDENIIYEPLIREVLAGRGNFNPSRITCLYEKSCGAVIFRRHSGNVEYLLIKNRKGNNWGFPKGHMEMHESERQTAVREVREETGLNIRPLDGFRTISEYHPKGRITKQVIFSHTLGGRMEIERLPLNVSLTRVSNWAMLTQWISLPINMTPHGASCWRQP